MSRTEPWVLEPWHIRVTLRKCLFHVPDDAIELPPDEIRGPDPSIQNKLFYVTITVRTYIFIYFNKYILISFTLISAFKF